MRFVLLGDDPDGIALLQAVDQSPEHVIAAAVGIGSPEVLSRLSPDVERFDDWRRVLTVADVDAALVATSDPDLLTGARQLASRGTSLAIVPCRRQDTAFAYELALVQDERPVTILPLFRHLSVPAIQALKAIIDAGLGATRNWSGLSEPSPQISRAAASPAVPSKRSSSTTSRCCAGCLVNTRD